MTEIFGNIWQYYNREFFRILIPTNGDIKNNGCGVMGRGVARQAVFNVPGIEYDLGNALKSRGNVVSRLTEHIYSFPTKHHWQDRSNMDLIRDSAEQLCQLLIRHKTFNWVLPRPGCGNGRLQWVVVRPVLISLPDNLWIISIER